MKNIQERESEIWKTIIEKRTDHQEWDGQDKTSLQNSIRIILKKGNMSYIHSSKHICEAKQRLNFHYHTMNEI